jgi:biopolymer transport protein ExbD
MNAHTASRTAFPAEDPEFQVAPMIDVLLVLMTFFMAITSTEVLRTKTRLITIQPPVAPAGREPADNSRIIFNVGWDAVRGEGRIECEEQALKSPSEITSRVLIRKHNRPGFCAVIRGSKEVPYRYMQEVMVACANAGVDNIAFVVVNRESRRK